MGRVILFTLALFFIARSSVHAQVTGPASQPITITFQRDSLPSALHKLQLAITGDFAYDPAIIPGNKTVNGTFNKVALGTVLSSVLFGSGLTYRVVGNGVVIYKKKAETYTIDGHVTDRASGEELIGATIYIPALQLSAISNQYGFYSLTLPEGDYELATTSIGFARSVKMLHLDKDLSIDIELVPQSYNLNEVVIGSYDQPAVKWRTGKELPGELLNRLPYYAGEVDAIKALQMESGIKAVTAGGPGLFVHGGNLDQNLISLDEAMVYNPSHLFGLVSVFNSDAIKQVQLYNDYIPANYGGRLSSVLDIRMADGNNREFHIRGGASLLSAHVSAEGPIRKGTGSFLLTARRSLTDLLHQNFRVLNSNSSYYDLNLKANYQVTETNKVFYSLYFGDDQLLSKNSFNNNWGNITSTIRWNHEFNSKIFFNLSAVYSDYSNLLDVNADTLSEKYHWKTAVRDLSLKGDFTYYRSPGSELKFGAISTHHRFVPGETTNAQPYYYNIPFNMSWESAVYFSHQLALRPDLQFNYGIRASLFQNGEERRDVFDAEGNQVQAKEYSSYFRLEPRLYLAYLPTDEQRIHVTYNRCNQFLQLIQNGELTFSSLETWMPSSAATKPQRSDYWSVGYDYAGGRYGFSINSYYKLLAHQVDLVNHAQVIRNPAVRSELTYGKSTSYGTELSVSRKTEHLSLDAAYSYSRVYKTMAAINDGQRFRANYDVPHELKTTQAWTPTPQFTLSSFFTLSSGRVATLPVGYFVQDGIKVPMFEGRNRSRFPLFNRWDLEARLKIDPKKPGVRVYSQVISVGIYNVYNHKNPLFFRVRQSGDDPASLYETATGIFPWAAYSFKF